MAEEATQTKSPEQMAKNPDKYVEELVIENKRKQEEIQELRTEHSDFKREMEEKLAEMEERLAVGQQPTGEQKTMLEKKQAIKNNPDMAVWIEIQKELAEEAAQTVATKAQFQSDFDNSRDLISEIAKSEGVDKKTFENELSDILSGGRWKYNEKGYEELPTRRVKMAYSEWLKGKMMKEELRKAKGESAPFMEGGGTRAGVTMPPSSREEIAEAKKSGNWVEILRRTHERQEVARAEEKAGKR